MNQEIEQEIQAKGLTAPRITPADIEANIASEHYFTAQEGIAGSISDDMVNRFLCWPVPASVYPDGTPGQPGRTGTNLLTADQAEEMLQHVVVVPEAPQALSLLTFCVLVLRNGFTVTGESACASPENFDADLGRKIARRNAEAKIWPLMGYELRSKLASGTYTSSRCETDGMKCVPAKAVPCDGTYSGCCSSGENDRAINCYRVAVSQCGKVNSGHACTMPQGSECPDCCGILGETIGMGD